MYNFQKRTFPLPLQLLIVGSLRQTQFFSSLFCRGALMSRLHSPFISILVFLLFFSQVVRYQVFVFRLGLYDLFTCPNYLKHTFLHLSVMFSNFSLSPGLCPSTHLHLCHFQFLHIHVCKLVNSTISSPYSIAI